MISDFIIAWEQRKLGDCAFYRRGSFPQPYGKKEWYDGIGSMPFVQVADVTDAMKLTNDTKQKISKLAQTMSVFAEKNSVLVTLQGSIGRVAITQYGAFVDRTVLIFERYKEEIYIPFWAYIIKQKFIEEAQKAPGGTIKTITKETLSNFDLKITKYNEQTKIGTFFNNLDNLITLHQRKQIACLELDPMKFSKKINSWEQRKLGDIMDVTSVKRVHQSDWKSEGVRFLRARDIVAAMKNEAPDDYLFISKEKYDEFSKISGKVEIDDLLVTGVGTIGIPYLIRNSEPLYFKDGNIIWFRNKQNVYGKFLYFFFTHSKIQNFIKEAAGTGTVGTYTIDSGKKTPISLPIKSEQTKIGTFFNNLDNLITLHQRKRLG